MSADLEKLILGHCLLDWDKMKPYGISSRTFSKKEHRDIYLAAKKQGPGAKGRIDVAMLSQSMNGKVSASYVLSLLEGLPLADRENVPKYLAQLDLAHVTRKVSSYLQSGEKTGDWDEDAAENLLAEISSAKKLATGSGLVSRAFSEIDPEPLEWLWHGRIPMGKITILAGDPGTGKSFLSLYLAAQVSTGGAWPDIGQPRPERSGSVILMSAEDDPADTIRPRLDDAGADVSKIHLVEGMRSNGKIVPFCVEDSDLLQDMAKELPDLQLVILDPISFYMGAGIDLAKDNKVRGSLEPLQKFAAEYNVAVFCITHLNKNQAVTQALYRVRDSLAFVATSRASHLLSRDPDEPEIRRFTPLKCNLTLTPPGLEFSIQEGKVVFSGATVEIDPDEALAVPEPNEREPSLRVVEAVVFLKEHLKDGPETVESIMKAAEKDGLTEKIDAVRKKSL